MLTGKLLAKKLGMTSFYDANNELIALTVLQVVDCTVLRIKTEEKDGYKSLVVGHGLGKVKNLTKPHAGIFSKLKIDPLRSISEFRLYKNLDEKDLSQGSKFTLKDFGVIPNQLVDVSGVSKGKGFAGVMKKYHFGGLEASHGVSASHRSGGSTGGCQDPGRVWKNKKMAGQMGAKNVTVQNLQVFSVDIERNLLLIRGALPGPKNGMVLVRDAIKEQIIQRGRRD
jgi:large subunit ribosomal protein L3